MSVLRSLEGTVTCEGGAVKSLQDFMHVTVAKWSGIMHLKVISKDVAGRLTTPESTVFDV